MRSDPLVAGFLLPRAAAQELRPEPGFGLGGGGAAAGTTCIMATRVRQGLKSQHSSPVSPAHAGLALAAAHVSP